MRILCGWDVWKPWPGAPEESFEAFTAVVVWMPVTAREPVPISSVLGGFDLPGPELIAPLKIDCPAPRTIAVERAGSHGARDLCT